MELQRGVCSLCSESSRVLTSSDAEEFCKFLPELYENFLTQKEFQRIKNSIKVCGICCYKIQVAVETKNLLSSLEEDEIQAKKKSCHFCKTDKYLMKVDSWKYFSERTEGYVNATDFPVCACPKCLFYFDVIFNIKTKLLYKFPQLGVPKGKSTDTPQRQNDTPKRKSLSKSPQSSKKRKIFDNCFTYLQPLCNNKYHVDEKLRKDKRLYRKIAYVNLQKSKNIDVKETPKIRPVIKIKLKPRSKKNEKELGNKTHYVKLCKSEEISSKSAQHKVKSRRHSYIDLRESSEEPEEKLDETPKAASVTNLVPKRRVSLFIDNGENEEDKETTEQHSDEMKEPEECVSEETAPEEEETVPEETEDINKNGIDTLNSDNSDKDVTPETQLPDDVVNGDEPELAELNLPEEIPKRAPDYSSDSSNSSPRKTPSKSGSSSDGSDSDTSDKDTTRDNPGLDVLNLSDRKKKRVTFSDEIND